MAGDAWLSMPPGRSKRARLRPHRGHAPACGAVHPPTKVRPVGPDVFALDHPGAGSLRLRRRPADPWVRRRLAAPGFHAGCMLTSNRGSIRGPMGGMQLPGPRQDVVGWERLLLFRRRARNATDQVDGAPGWGWA